MTRQRAPHFGLAQPQAYPSAHLYDNYSMMDNLSIDNLDDPYFDEDFEDEDYIDDEDTDMDLYYDEELYDDEDDEDDDLEEDYYGDELLKPRIHRQRYMPARAHFYEDVEDEDIDSEEPLPVLHQQSQKGYHLKPKWHSQLHPTQADGIYDLVDEDPVYHVSERELLLARLE